MSAKTSHRRVNGTAKMGGRVQGTELDMLAWTVVGSEGIEFTVYTLGARPEGYRKAVLREARP